MRRALTVLLGSALAAVLLAGAALADTTPTFELTVTPADPKAGDAVVVQAYVHFGAKPYQGANVEFVISGPGMQTLTLHGKPGQAGYYRNQFTPPASGDFQIATRIDGTQPVPKPYHLQVAAAEGSIAAAWLPITGGGALLALLVLIGGAIASRGRSAQRVPATG